MEINGCELTIHDRTGMRTILAPDYIIGDLTIDGQYIACIAMAGAACIASLTHKVEFTQLGV